MAKIGYLARTLTGEVVEGNFEAQSADELRLALSRKGLELVECDEGSLQKEEEVASGRTGTRFRLTVKNTSLCSVTGQLALMIEAGASVVQSFDTLAEETNDRRLSDVLGGVCEDIRGGSSISAALASYPRVFDQFYVSSIRTGESSGSLPSAFRRLEKHMERREAFLSTLRAALVYPIILTVLAFGAVVFMLMFVLPKFIAVFKQNNVELPLPTRILLQMVTLLQTYWYVVPLLLLAMIAVAYWQLTNRRNIAIIDRMVLSIPVAGTLLKTVHSSIVLRSLGTLLESGVPMLETLNVVQEGCGNHSFRAAIEDVQTSVLQGDGFASKFKENTLFPASIRQIISTGESTGNLPIVMNRSADHLELDADKQLKRLSTLFEPLVIIVMGVMVGFIAISVLMPLFNLTSALRGGV